MLPAATPPVLRPKSPEAYGVRLDRVRALRGPNMYAYMPVMRATIDIGPYEERPSNQFPGFVDRLLTWLPGLEEHECSIGRRGGFVKRLNRGTYLAHITEHVVLELQGRISFDVRFGRVRGTGDRGVYDIVFAYQEEEAAREALEVALRLTLAAMHDEPFDARDELRRLEDLADRYRLGPSTQAIVDAARARSIPVVRLTPTSSLVQLGYGIHQKRIRASQTSETSSIATDLCQDKPLTNNLLRAVAIPVPEGRPVFSPEEAWSVAQGIGLPVVLKPEAGNHGRGVSVNLTTEQEVREAYDLAWDQRRGDVLVERYIRGSDHRILVVNGKMVAAARRDPAHVIGDGKSTIEQLVARENRNPRRREGHASLLTRITLNAESDLVLGQQGLARDSVPDADHKVFVRQNGNLSTGGTATDVTDEVHPRNARIAELAAQVLGMDVAGIDIICDDLSRPLREQGGAIVEVNAAPGLRMHIAPTNGKSRDVGKPIMDMLYAPGETGRIPIIAITGTNGKTTTTRLIAHMYEQARYTVGITCTDGVYVDGERVTKGDSSGPKSARAVLLHPRVEVAVLETARGGILREGLAWDSCSVGVVTNVTGDHLGIGGINTIQDLAKIKQVVVENVRRDGVAVLNAEDMPSAEMAAACDGEVMYFSTNERNPVYKAHVEGGGRAVLGHQGAIYLVEGDQRTHLIGLDRIEFTSGGKIPFQVQNALAATGAAWGAGLNPVMIVRGLTTFITDTETAPGRFNVTQYNTVEVIFDYGHNIGGLVALGDAVRSLGDRKTILLIGLPGDRRDQDLIESVRVTLPWADEYVFYDQRDRRGRAVMEVPKLLQAQVPEGVRTTLTESQEAGIRTAWALAKPGDRLLIIADEVDEGIELVETLASGAAEETACATPISGEGMVRAAA